MKTPILLFVCVITGLSALQAGADSPVEAGVPAFVDPSSATPLPGDAPVEIRDAMEWFDRLGYPSIKGRERVRVTDERFDAKGENKGGSVLYGWLLEETEGQWTLLCGPDPAAPFSWDGEGPWPLEPWTVSAYDKTTDDHVIGAWRSVRRIEKADFKVEAEAVLAAYKGDQEKVWGQQRNRFGKVMSLRAAFFILGRDCLVQGHRAAGMELLTLTPAIQGDVDDKRSLRQKLEDELGMDALWRSTLDFSSPRVSRETILTRLETGIKRFPSADSAPRLQEMAERLRIMLGDDREHTAKAKPFEQMTPVEQVAELIFQLRNQNGSQWSQPGECDVFRSRGGNTDQPSPALRLVEMGHVAVPGLIGALGSGTYSRSVGFHRNFRFSHRVLTVGDCALIILSRIADRSFHRPRVTTDPMSGMEEWARTRAEVEAWWARLRRDVEHRLPAATRDTGK